MFTGIIQELGEVTNIEDKQNLKIFTIKSSKVVKDKKIGDSIAHNGACLTITDFTEEGYKCEAIEETLKVTNLGSLKVGDIVNLEESLKMGSSLDGHFVQGHVDNMGTVADWKENNLEIIFPPELAKYLSYKGSVTINGVSLTISKLNEKSLEVSLIPHTLEHTNLGKLKKNDKVNLEIDMLARYLESLLNSKNSEAKYEFLKERGFI